MFKLNLPVHYNGCEILYRNSEPERCDKIAIYYNDEQITYSQLIENSDRAGNVLKQLGIPEKSFITMLMHNTPLYPAVFFGGIKAGYKMALANTLLKAVDYEHMLKDCKSTAIILDENLYAEIEPIRAACPELKYVIVIGGDYQNTLRLEKLMTQAPTQLNVAPTSPKDIAFVMYSSGSTGFPKGVVHLHEGMAYVAALDATHVIGVRKEDTVFSVTKLFLSATFENLMVSPYSAGASTVLLKEPPTPENVFDLLEKHQVTILWAPPAFYKAMVEMPDASKRNLSSLRLCTAGVEKLSKSVAAQWYKNYGVEIVPELGSTEMFAAFVVTYPGKGRENSVGKPTPGFDIKIVDTDGNEVKRGEMGVLMVRGGSRAAYYLNNPEKTKFAMRDEWFYTNDIFHEDEDGYLYTHGRADDQFKIRGGGGLAVLPAEVEATLIEHKAVKECLVSPGKNKDDVTIVRAEVVLKDSYKNISLEEKESIAQELKELCLQKLSPHKVPEDVQFVQEFPKISYGKIKRKSANVS